MEVRLPPTVDHMWKKISTGLRNKIRKGQKSDLRVQWAGYDGIDTFYDVFALNMRNLGTPVYPKRWFQEIYRATPDSIHILNLWSGDRPVASAFLIGYGDTLELPWSASAPDSRKQYSHVLLYWTFLEWAIQNGYQTMDLGRCTPGGGTYEFKRHWGCDEKAMQWYYWSPPGSALPETRTDNKKFKLAIEAWKHLPLSVANRLGPHIVRALP
jgi:FemAB-related protein (PEP-CTERM system-associated)